MVCRFQRFESQISGGGLPTITWMVPPLSQRIEQLFIRGKDIPMRNPAQHTPFDI
jgi:hypothetical protein